MRTYRLQLSAKNVSSRRQDHPDHRRKYQVGSFSKAAAEQAGTAIPGASGRGDDRRRRYVYGKSPGSRRFRAIIILCSHGECTEPIKVSLRRRKDGMILLGSPAVTSPVKTDSCLADPGHSLSSLTPPLAAVASLPPLAVPEKIFGLTLFLDYFDYPYYHSCASDAYQNLISGDKWSEMVQGNYSGFCYLALRSSVTIC